MYLHVHVLLDDHSQDQNSANEDESNINEDNSDDNEGTVCIIYIPMLYMMPGTSLPLR